MKKHFTLACCLLILPLPAGCFKTVYTGENLGYLASLNEPKPGEKIVDHFREHVWNYHFFFGLLNTSDMDLAGIITNTVPPGHAVRNLTIQHQASFGNMFIGFLTFYIYTPMTTVISGDIVETDRQAQASARLR